MKVLIVGGGPAGLSCAIKLKSARPDIEVCVVEKAAELGNHNLSGAVLEPKPLHKLLDSVVPAWQQSEEGKTIFSRRVKKDDTMFLPGKNIALNISFSIKAAKMLHLGFGQMLHKNDYIVSISKLTKYLGSVARRLGAEVLTGFAAEDILLNSADRAVLVKLVDQGKDKHGKLQPNFVKGELLIADFVVLAEGCDGLVTEKFIQYDNLARQSPQLYSVGIKEIIKVSAEQYEKFGDNRVVHAMGYPLWTPVLGPAIFGGGLIYSMGDNLLAVGMIAGADWKYCDFNPQEALTLFKQHRFVRQFVEGGTVVEAGAKMIPEGGYYAIPRHPLTKTIGNGSVLIAGDSAGFVNMHKIKGLHNALESGMYAADAVITTLNRPAQAAAVYTGLLNGNGVISEMSSARNFRQTVAKFGNLIGMPLSSLGGLLPKFEVEKDYMAMTPARYKYKGNKEFDKDTFTALAATAHREEQPCHLKILDERICVQNCEKKFGAPCIRFCPAGVYETIQGSLKPANPSNCLHCKTCQRKCPFDNIRWTAPEGGGGPRYKQM